MAQPRLGSSGHIGPGSAVRWSLYPCDPRHLSGVPGGSYHWGMSTWRIGVFLVVGALACNLDVGGTTFVPTPPPAPPALQLVAQGLTSPLYLTAPPGDTTRQFIVQQDGRIRVVRNDTLLTTPFLDIRTLVTYGGERGLLGLAFHPNYKVNGWFYVYYTDLGGNIRILRLTVSAGDPNVADPTTGDTVLAVAHSTYNNHNGGMVVFGPDGYLYTGLGDGGGGGDPLGNGQNKHALLGKILRLDVDHGSPYTIPGTNPFVGDTSARAEIWDYGLRNPWRFSFDRSNGYLYIADVGQDLYEEVDVEPTGGVGRVNYGWNVMEGMHCYNATTCNTAGLTLPVLEYTHTNGQCAIIGGYVYRGKRVPALAGMYLYADLCVGWVHSFEYVFGRVGNQLDWSTQLFTGTNVSSFGEDGRGELYIINLGGNVYRMVPGT